MAKWPTYKESYELRRWMGGWGVEPERPDGQWHVTDPP
jgi:hypothetical protein